MDELARIRHKGETLTLDELVAAANRLLPHYLPEDADGRKLRRDEVNPRLVRHFATLGLLDEAGREGREARYGARHLLQLLVVRRLMAEGHVTAAIKKLTAGARDEELEALLQSGARLAVESAVSSFSAPAMARSAAPNAALHFLQSVKARASAPIKTEPPPTPAPQIWRRLPLENSLELHIREDFRPPATPYERENLLRRIENELKNLTNKPSRRQK